MQSNKDSKSSKNSIFTLKEISAATDTEEAYLLEWIHAGLIEPVGQSDESTPYFGNRAIDKIRHVKQFSEMGYTIEEIRKILRKVGIPTENKGGRRSEAEGEQFLTVGTLAERVGISSRTLKHWEEKGIIEPDMRSQGGFRLYKEHYVFFCKLIQDLQLFGYSLDEIERISDFFRDFVAIRADESTHPPKETHQRLQEMQDEIGRLFEKTTQLKEGISRWEELLRTHKKQIVNLQNKNRKKLPEESE